MRKRLSITSLFTGATLGPLIVVGVLLLYLAVRTTNQVSDSLGEQVMAQVTRRVQDAVIAYLHESERTSDVFSDLLVSQVMPEDDIERWRASMLTRLRTTPEVASIGFANAADDYVYLMRFPPELEFGVGKGSAEGTLTTRFPAYLDGRLGPAVEAPRSFKVRERPWYQQAIAADAPTWTPAYTWFTAETRPPNPEYSIAYTRAVHDPKTGRFLGVLSIDTLLTRVNTRLQELSRPLDAFLVITDTENVLIGASELGAGEVTLPEGRMLKEIDHPVARALSAEIAANGTAELRSTTPTRLIVGDQTYWVAQSPLTAGPGAKWFVTIAIPDRSILTGARTSIRWILTIGTAYLTFAGIIAIVLARLVTRPLRRLAAFTRDVGDGNFDQRIDVGSTREIAELSDKLNAMAVRLKDRVTLLAQRDAAEQATAVKSRLIAHVSHEFRTPLNAIINYAELLRDTAAGEGCLRDAADATNIVTASRHLLSLVENLLDLSMIDAGRVRLETCRFSIAGLVNEVASTSRPVVEKQHNRQHVVLPAQADAEMISDPTRVRQILINLLGNAGKFTHDGDVTLNVSVDDASRNIMFEVRDTGPGIAPEQLGRLFRPFGHAVVGDRPGVVAGTGAGLGLAISRQLARILGGDITVETGPSGTRMFVTLPLDGPPSGESSAIA